MEEIYILHEYGAPRHFKAIEFLKEKKEIDKITYIEFNILRSIVKGILKLKVSLVFRAIRNFFLIFILILTKDKKIVLGMAPYDKFIYIAELLRKKHQVYYFTSWPYWDKSSYPQKNLFFKNRTQKKWNNFLKKVKIVTVTKKTKKSLVQNDLNIASKIFAIPHSVDVSIFKPLNNKTEFSKKSKTKILYVGRLVEEKGLFYINKLINDLSEEKFEFNIVGYGKDKKILESNFCKSHVTFYGKIKDKNTLAMIYRDNDILILPSFKTKTWEELFGIVLIEAMASGLALISTDCIGPQEIISNYINGFIVPQKNYKELKNKILILRNNKKLLKKIKNENVEIARLNYSEEICSRKWLEVLKD